jgi:hypothetical protein
VGVVDALAGAELSHLAASSALEARHRSPRILSLSELLRDGGSNGLSARQNAA